MRIGSFLWITVAAVLGTLLVVHFYKELDDDLLCDTTYIYEGYDSVELPSKHPRYSILRYFDRDPLRQEDISTLRARAFIAPVLFIHGNAGTEQQMRSLASESSRECTRRGKTHASSPPVFLEWYAARFNEEPSALQPHLVPEQASFTSESIKFLYSKHSTKIMIITHSMGGVIAAQALTLLGSKDSHRMVSCVLSLSAPLPPVPTYMPPAYAHAVSSKKDDDEEEDVYKINILSSPGDIFHRHTHSRSADEKATMNNRKTLSVRIEDIPGVWTGATHQSIVSCNQLVRTVIPFLLDSVYPVAAVAAAAGEGNERRDDASIVAELAKDRFTASQTQQKCEQTRKPTSSEVVVVVDKEMTFLTAEEPTLVHFSSFGPFIVLSSGHAPPCAENQPTPVLQLPPLLETQRYVPRPWFEVIAGIDWHQNTTWVSFIANRSSLYVAQGVSIIATPAASPATTIGGGGESRVIIQSPFTSSTTTTANVSSSPLTYLTFAESTPIRTGLSKLIFGHSRGPSMLTIAQYDCKATGAIFRPLLIVIDADDGQQLSQYGAEGPWKLWLTRDEGSLVLVTDPRCDVVAKVDIDIGAWVATALRHQVYALPALIFAMSLSNKPLLLSLLSLPIGVPMAEAVCILLLASGVALILQAVMSVVSGRRTAPHFSLPSTGGYVVFLSGTLSVSVIHPCLPVVLGTLFSILFTTAINKKNKNSNGHHHITRAYVAYLPMPLSWVYAWVVNGCRYGYDWLTLDRLLLVLLAYHVVLLTVMQRSCSMYFTTPPRGIMFLSSSATVTYALLGIFYPPTYILSCLSLYDICIHKLLQHTRKCKKN